MTGNLIGVEGAKIISKMLKVNTTLTSLDLESGEEEIKKRKNKKEAVSFLEIAAYCYYDESVLKRKRAQKDVFKEFVHVHSPTMQQP